MDAIFKPQTLKLFGPKALPQGRLQPGTVLAEVDQLETSRSRSSTVPALQRLRFTKLPLYPVALCLHDHNRKTSPLLRTFE